MHKLPRMSDAKEMPVKERRRLHTYTCRRKGRGVAAARARPVMRSAWSIWMGSAHWLLNMSDSDMVWSWRRLAVQGQRR